LNVLEALRTSPTPASLIFASTNKVYGVLDDIALDASPTRHWPVDPGIRTAGISERRSLDFHSPYGCSKGAADQYVLDYARSFGLRAAVLRMSCIYGPHQNGTEDQGWVAHFLKAVMAGASITVFGSGRQVRDLLFVDDLVEAFERVRARIELLRGRAFNLGGGAAHAVSVLEVLERIERLTGQAVGRQFQDWRTGDQRYYVSDTRALQEATQWRPRTDVDTGLAALHEWLRGGRLRGRSAQERSPRALLVEGRA
jgi:CDP-paratose 2-epimerase